VLEHDDGKFLWFHPRVAAIPAADATGPPSVLLTMQKHLHTSDYYSGLNVMRTADLGKTWTPPDARAELDWVPEPGGVNVAVCDVTPGWHPQSKKLIAVGAQVRYSAAGEQLEDRPRSNQTAYAVFEPKSGEWSRWRRLEMPPDEKFNFAYSACAQFLVEPDGTLLLPFYFGPNAKRPFSVTVVRCSFDGTQLKYLEHGDEISLDVVRGLVEPSLVKFQDRYYLTIRNDLKGYVTVGDDPLHYRPIKAWTFDDGAELGSYNTQQHWLAHGDALFLAYTRKGANNDHVFRHRAPLFIAQVDPRRLHVLRATERVLIPERGATLGNFGAAAIDARESWVADAEGIFSDDARRRGATGAVYLARVIWPSTPGDRQARAEPAQGAAYQWINVTHQAAYAPRDGAGALTFHDRMWLLGGWNPGDKTHFPRICNNEVWSSADGARWTLEKPNTFLDRSFDPASDWEGRHTAGYVVFKDRMWIIGGDSNQGHYQNDVWT
ncbi:MAG: sialidase family protein, partial [Pirellulales bacterium]